MTSHCYTKICPNQQIHWNVKNRRNFSISAENPLLSLVSFLLFRLYPVSCLLSPVSFLLSQISYLSSPVSRLSVFLLLSPVSCLLSQVFCLTPPVSRLPCCKCCIFSGISDFIEQISVLGQFSDLNVLSGLSELKANFFSGYGVERT